MLHANRLPGSLTINDGLGSDVEEAAGQHESTGDLSPEHPSVALPSTPTPGEDFARSSPSTDDFRRGLNHAEDSHDAQSADPGRGLSISALESTCQETPTDQPDPHHTQQNGEISGTTVGVDEGPPGCDEVSILETGRFPQGGSMALANLIAARRSTAIDDDTAGQHHMEHGGYAGETALTESKQTGHGVEGAHGKRTRQRTSKDSDSTVLSMPFPARADLCRSFETIRLANHDNWCFINSAFLATAWAMLSCDEFTERFWGPHAIALANFLQTPTNDFLSLAQFVELRLLVSHWADRNRINQGDAVEFLAFMLRGLDFTGYDMRWEIRLQIGSLTQIQDQNADASTPIVLQFDPAQLAERQIHIQHMVMEWSNQHGRQVALTGNAPLICVHVDRHVASGAGDITKSDIAINVHGGCQFPHYTGHDLRVSWKEYQVVAMIAHFGIDNSGHCRAMLFTDPATNASETTLAFMTEDWEHVTRVNNVPYWFKSNVQCIWLCQANSLALYKAQGVKPDGNVPLDAPEPTMADLIRTLAST